MTLQNKINVFVFVFVHKKHSSYLLRKLNSSLKCAVLAECSFPGATVKLSQQIGGTTEVDYDKRGSSGQQEEDTREDFFTLFGHGV